METIEWLNSLRARWLAGDPQAISELFAADAVYYQGPFGTPHRGRREIAEHWTQTLSRQRQPLISFGSPVVSGNRAAVEWWCILHDPQTAEPRTAAGCVMLRFNDAGQCLDLHEYWHGIPGTIHPNFSDFGEPSFEEPISDGSYRHSEVP